MFVFSKIPCLPFTGFKGMINNKSSSHPSDIILFLFFGLTIPILLPFAMVAILKSMQDIPIDTIFFELRTLSQPDLSLNPDYRFSASSLMITYIFSHIFFKRFWMKSFPESDRADPAILLGFYFSHWQTVLFCGFGYCCFLYLVPEPIFQKLLPEILSNFKYSWAFALFVVSTSCAVISSFLRAILFMRIFRSECGMDFCRCNGFSMR